MGNMDVLLLVPKEGSPIDGMNGQAHGLPPESKAILKKHGVIIREVEWALPPGMLFLPTVPWCGSKDFMRLHVMGLEGYAAAVYMDFDVQLQEPQNGKGLHKDMAQLFQCAAQDNILWTGDVMGPINIGVFAVKPRPAIKEAGMNLLQAADYTRITGWGGAGHAPQTGSFIGSECGQGLFHTMFFKSDYGPVQLAAQQAGTVMPPAHMVDLCKWNYLHGWECPKKLRCEDVVLIHKQSMDKDGCHAKQKFGFYMHAHWEEAAVLKQLRDVRHQFRDSPVYMLSDGGLNFTKMCASDNYCKFAWKPPSNDRWNPKPFLDRFRQAAEWLDSDFVVLLEPDVTIHDYINRLPTADAGGIRDSFNPALSQPLRQHLEELGRNSSGNKDFKLLWDHFGLAGGSIFRQPAVLKSFWPDRIDWKKMESLDGKRVYSSDVSMAIALSVHGFTYEPWAELKLGPESSLIQSQPQGGSAFQHHGADEPHGKPLYGVKLEGNDAHLFEEPPKGTQDINCQHCVWGEEKDCWPAAGVVGGKISCPISDLRGQGAQG
jgi:hypothetical protein